MDYEVNPSIDIPNYTPSAFLGDPCVDHTLFVRSNQPLLYGETKILTSDFDVKLLRYVCKRKFDLITMDAEGSEGDNWRIIDKLLGLLDHTRILSDNGVAIFKVFGFRNFGTLSKLFQFYDMITAEILSQEQLLLFSGKILRAD